MSLTDRLDAYLDDEGLEAVWFARPNSFAWLTGGGDNVVDRGGDVGVAAAGYDGDEIQVVTDNIEAPRLRDEELADGTPIETFDWHARGLAEVVESVSPTPAAADFAVEGFDSVDAAALRQPLTDDQIDTYRALGADVAGAVESVGRSIEPDDTELDVTAALRRELEAGIATPVVLVGGGERAQSYRHYTPKDEPLGGYALLSVTASRAGLHTSCTRTVAFDAPDWLGERTEAAMRVEATALAATREVGREGGTAADVFDAIRDAYDAVGWDGEWRNHHQGGAAGFAGREWIATPSSDAPVVLPQGYAWNPTVQGAKSEDTHLVTDDGVETLSTTGEWPTRTVDAVGNGLELPRHDVLDR
ncbi:M24 family metallopeptidase [Halomicroarcula sp. GCM10025709]|uniref:M24 family metallopeptidase n=1 Tax=Halomicroarcula sp. GCM10025709 TaxID=3252669 RepID=UPI00360CB41D